MSAVPENDLAFLLRDLSMESVCQSLRDRYESGLMESTVGTTLVSVNPKRFLESGIRVESHPRALSEAALAGCLRQMNVQQVGMTGTGSTGDGNGDGSLERFTFVVSGPSGSGKSSLIAHLMQHLCTKLKGSDARNGDGTTETTTSLAGELLRVLGHAKTDLNDDSSRFSKLFIVNVETAEAKVKTYLLERSRVTFQQRGQGSMHVFHLLYRQSRQADAARGPMDPNVFSTDTWPWLTILRAITRARDDGAQGAARPLKYLAEPETDLPDGLLEQWISNMAWFGMNADDMPACLSVLTGILVLGDDVRSACRLWGLEYAKFIDKVSRPGGMQVKGLERGQGAVEETLASLARTIFAKFFDFVVQMINRKLELAATADGSDGSRQQAAASKSIGFLDMAGFESFSQNHFFQFCINWSNEKLHHLLDRGFYMKLAEMYREEGLDLPPATFSHANANANGLDEDQARPPYPSITVTGGNKTGKTCLDFVEGQTASLISTLEDLKLTRDGPTDTAAFVRALQELHARTHPTAGLNRKGPSSSSSRSSPRPVWEIDPARDGNGIDARIRLDHYAGGTEYKLNDWVECNAETVDQDLVKWIAATTTNPLLRRVLSSGVIGSRPQGSKTSVVKVQRQALNKLMNEIGETNIIRVICVRVDSPSSTSTSTSTLAPASVVSSPRPDDAPPFDVQAVWKQLSGAGLDNLIKLNREYPTLALPKEQFVARYRMIMPVHTATILGLDSESLSELEIDGHCESIARIVLLTDSKLEGRQHFTLGPRSALFSPLFRDALENCLQRRMDDLQERRRIQEEQEDKRQIELRNERLAESLVEQMAMPDSTQDEAHGVRVLSRPSFFDEVFETEPSARPADVTGLSGRVPSPDTEPDVDRGMANVTVLPDGVWDMEPSVVIDWDKNDDIAETRSRPAAELDDAKCALYALTYYLDHLPTRYWKTSWFIPGWVMSLERGLAPSQHRVDADFKKLSDLLRERMAICVQELELCGTAAQQIKLLDTSLFCWVQSLRMQSACILGRTSSSSASSHHDQEMGEYLVALHDHFIAPLHHWSTRRLQEVYQRRHAVEPYEALTHHVQACYNFFGLLCLACEKDEDAVRAARKGFMAGIIKDIENVTENWFASGSRSATPFSLKTTGQSRLLAQHRARRKRLIESDECSRKKIHKLFKGQSGSDSAPRGSSAFTDIAGFRYNLKLADPPVDHVELVVNLAQFYRCSTGSQSGTVTADRISPPASLFVGQKQHAEFWADLGIERDDGHDNSDIYEHGWRVLGNLGLVMA